MTSLENVARIAVAVLLNSLWEDAILVLAVWFLLRVARESNASTRYFSWLVTLIAAVVLPIVTTIPQISVSSPGHVIRRSLPSHSPSLPGRTRVFQTTQSAGQPPVPFRFPNRFHVALPKGLTSLFFGLWMLVTLAIGTRLVIDFFRLERLKRDSLPLPFDVRDGMERWLGAAYGRRREVRICVSNKIEVPVAVGLFDSMILLPQQLLHQFSAGEIDSISLHELAHLHRNDDLANAFQRVAQTVFFFNPAIRYIASQLDLEREVACDDWVLSLTGDVRPYATCLAKMAEITAWPHTPLAAPGVFVTRKGISVRIERLLNKHRNARAQVGVAVPIAVSAVLVAFFVLVDVVAPTIAFKEETTVATVRGVTNKVKTVSRARGIAMQWPARSSPWPAVPSSSVGPRPRETVIRITRPVSVPPHWPSPSIIRKSATVRIQRTIQQRAPVSEINVHVPEINVRVPGTDVHVPAMDMHVPATRIGEPGLPLRLASGDYSCSGCDFSNVNWAGKDLSHRSFGGSDFSGANLAHANFTGSHLSGVDFSRANLSGSNFTDADLSGSDMSHANLSGAVFSGAHLSGLSGLNPAELDPAQARMLLDKCSGCDLTHVNLRGMDLHGIHLSGTDLAKSDLRGANLQDVNFSGVDLSGALLQGASLRGAHFSGCDLARTDLRNIDLTAVSFSGSDLREAIMK